MTMIAFPLLVDHMDRREGATIGLDVLAQFAPTFDPAAGRLFLRPGGEVAGAVGQRFATLTTPTDIRIARAGGWASLTQPSIARMLRERRWTFDARRGELVVTP